MKNFLLLISFLSFNLYANSSYQLVLNEMQKIALSCELDQVCIFETLEKKSLDNSEPHQAYWAREVFNMQQKMSKDELIQFEAACKTPELTSTRQAVASCLKKSDAKSGLRTCLRDTLTPLAQQNNIFAVNALAKQNEKIWQAKLQQLQQDPALQVQLRCVG